MKKKRTIRATVCPMLNPWLSQNNQRLPWFRDTISTCLMKSRIWLLKNKHMHHWHVLTHIHTHTHSRADTHTHTHTLKSMVQKYESHSLIHRSFILWLFFCDSDITELKNKEITFTHEQHVSRANLTEACEPSWCPMREKKLWNQSLHNEQEGEWDVKTIKVWGNDES